MEQDKRHGAEIELGEIPPRRVLHPPSGDRLTRIFYGTLTLVFIGLMAGLIVWGYHSNQ